MPGWTGDLRPAIYLLTAPRAITGGVYTVPGHCPGRISFTLAWQSAGEDASGLVFPGIRAR